MVSTTLIHNGKKGSVGVVVYFIQNTKIVPQHMRISVSNFHLRTIQRSFRINTDIIPSLSSLVSLTPFV